jgi:hypothetical protein
MKETGTAIEQVPLAPTALASLIQLVDRGTISSTAAKEVFAGVERVVDEGVAPRQRQGERSKKARDRAMPPHDPDGGAGQRVDAPDFIERGEAAADFVRGDRVNLGKVLLGFRPDQPDRRHHRFGGAW